MLAGSPAERAGLRPGDVLARVGGRSPRDLIEYHELSGDRQVEIDLVRDGEPLRVELSRESGEALGMGLDRALFDGVVTCDNRCEFCFVHQLPPGVRSSLRVKDDDYRLSFLYGNFTTLTRFTEADLERVVTDGLSPLYVSIHSTDPGLRSRMLRNRRGASSLRWLRALLDNGIVVHGQVVLCPGVNGGPALDQTLAGVLDGFPELASLCLVPLGVSRFNREEHLRPHTPEEASEVVETVHRWQEVFLDLVGRRLVHAADELYILADRPFPPADHYEGFPMHEDGVGMARTFEMEFNGEVTTPTGIRSGFFAGLDGAPADGYRAPRARCGPARRDAAPVTVVTGTHGAQILRPLLEGLGRDDVRVLTVVNRFFGGNVGVAGLLVGTDIASELAGQPEGDRHLIPDVCLSRGRFLDGTRPEDLPRAVEVVGTDGLSLRAAIGA